MRKLLATLISVVVIFAAPAQSFGADNGLTGEITVSCYDTMRYKSLLEYAAKAFEQANPGVKVNVSTFSSMPVIKTTTTEEGSMIMVSEYGADPKKEEDYLSQINTEMMSGGGADIFAVDILPYYKYADAGQLVDLREYMDSDPEFDYGDYQSSIFDAAMYRDGQYILPLDYNFECLSYDSTLMNTDIQGEFEFGRYTYAQLTDMGLDSFMSQFDNETENPIRLFNLYPYEGRESGATLFNALLNADYSKFIDVENKKANFTDGSFADILNTAKEYGDNGYLCTPINYQEMMKTGININDLLTQQSEQRCLYKTTNQLMLLYSLPDDSDNLLSGYNMGAAITKDDALIGLLSNDKGESPFTSSQVYAMNANSKNKQCAWEFLKFLLSDKMQGSFSISFTPINNNAAAQQTKIQISSIMAAPVDAEAYFESVPESEAATGDGADAEEDAAGDEEAAEDGETDEYDINTAILELASYSYFDIDAELTEKQQAVYDKYMDYMERYAPMLNSYIIRDSIIDGMITKEVENFFDGTKTAEAVASALQSRVNMYLQE